MPYGEWRLELEPADSDLDHHFLTLLYPTSSATMTLPPLDIIAGTGMEGVHVGDPLLNRVVLFSSAPDGASPQGPFSYTYTPTGPTQHLLFGLERGRRYQVSMLNSSGNVIVTLTPSEIGPLRVTGEGTLRFNEAGSQDIYVESEGLCNGHLPCYPTFQAGISAAETGVRVRVCEGRFHEEVLLEHAKEVFISSGWDRSYNGIVGPTSLSGPLTLAKGTLFLEEGSLDLW